MGQMEPISFACTALLGTNKAGDLKPNADGYYTVVLGALDFFNSANQFYPNSQSARELFKESSSFMRRIASGNLRGEYGHPRLVPGMSTRDFMVRCSDVYEKNISHHIRKVWIDYTSVKGPNGQPCIAIMGEIKPAGPMGDALRESLNNPSENVCFSIRSFTRDVPERGVMYKHLCQIVTWDFVTEPGISVAAKWKSPALESFFDTELTFGQLKEAAEISKLSHCSMESSGGLDLSELVESLSMEAAASNCSRPPSASW